VFAVLVLSLLLAVLLLKLFKLFVEFELIVEEAIFNSLLIQNRKKGIFLKNI